MMWAGPVEFSTGEIIALLLAMVAMALALPAVGGVIAVIMYRRGTPPEARSRGEAFSIFFRTMALVMLVQIAIAFAVGMIQELIG